MASTLNSRYEASTVNVFSEEEMLQPIDVLLYMTCIIQLGIFKMVDCLSLRFGDSISHLTVNKNMSNFVGI